MKSDFPDLSPQEIQNELYRIQLKRERIPGWRRNVIAVISLFISGIAVLISIVVANDERRKSILELQQLKVELNLTKKDSLNQLKSHIIARAYNDSMTLAENYDALEQAFTAYQRASAAERVRLYRAIDSLRARTVPPPDSTFKQIVADHIRHLNEIEGLATSPAGAMALSMMQNSNFCYEYTKNLVMQKYAQEVSLKEMMKRLERAERERCP